MSPTRGPPEEVRLKRTAMTTRELRRAEVLGRVKSKTLGLTDAAKILELSYRQTKRLGNRHRGEGAKGLQHRSAGRSSNRAKPEEFRRKVLQLIRKKYSVWTDAGSGALSGRGWAGSGRRDLATLDASGGVVEPHAATESTPEAESAAGALWRPGAVGWKFPCMV